MLTIEQIKDRINILREEDSADIKEKAKEQAILDLMQDALNKITLICEALTTKSAPK